MPRLYEDNNPAIVKHVLKVFQLSDIDIVLDYLEKKFRFNREGWAKHFGEYYSPNNRDKSIGTQFLEFGKKYIEPLLNGILCRVNYPTWIMMVAYLLRHKINAYVETGKGYRG